MKRGVGALSVMSNLSWAKKKGSVVLSSVYFRDSGHRAYWSVIPMRTKSPNAALVSARTAINQCGMAIMPNCFGPRMAVIDIRQARVR